MSSNNDSFQLHPILDDTMSDGYITIVLDKQYGTPTQIQMFVVDAQTSATGLNYALVSAKEVRIVMMTTLMDK